MWHINRWPCSWTQQFCLGQPPQEFFPNIFPQTVILSGIHGGNTQFASNPLHSAADFRWKAWVLLFQTYLLNQLFMAKCFVFYVQLKSGLPNVASQNTIRTDLQLSVNPPPTQPNSSSSLCTVCFKITLHNWEKVFRGAPWRYVF